MNSKSIVVNLSDNPITIENQKIAEFQSNYALNTELSDVEQALLIRNLRPDLLEHECSQQVGELWPSATRSVKRSVCGTWTLYVTQAMGGSTGVYVLLFLNRSPERWAHRDHSFCPIPGYREVHTQVVGVGKMRNVSLKTCRHFILKSLWPGKHTPTDV